MPRKISYERFASSQRKIEGAAEGARKKRKKEAAEKRETGPQVLKTPEEIAKETEDLVSARAGAEETVDLGGEKVKKEYLELEEAADKKAVKAEEKRKKIDPDWFNVRIKMHRKGLKPRKDWGEGLRKDYKEWRAEIDDYFTNERFREQLEWAKEREKLLKEFIKARDILNSEDQELPEGFEEDIEFLESLEEEEAA